MRRRPTITYIAALAATLALSACGSSSSSTTTATQASAPSSTTSAASTSAGASATTVKTASNSKLGGTILVDAHGMTLYRLSGEQNGKFICSASACTQIWRPLAATAGSTPTGVASLGTVKRPDGSEQVTYKGEPLYTFAQDKAPGEANGQGIKDVGTWTGVAAAPSAGEAPAATTATATTPAPASSGGGGGGYGY